jgi:hypothetical protein
MGRSNASRQRDFEYAMKQKFKNGKLYQHTFAGNDICGGCAYRLAWQNKCSKFNKPIQKVGQYNRGFHHLPCSECLEYKIQECDINYFTKSYENRRKKKV